MRERLYLVLNEDSPPQKRNKCNEVFNEGRTAGSRILSASNQSHVIASMLRVNPVYICVVWVILTQSSVAVLTPPPVLAKL